MMLNEAEIRAELIDPVLRETGWGVVEASRQVGRASQCNKPPSCRRARGRINMITTKLTTHGGKAMACGVGINRSNSTGLDMVENRRCAESFIKKLQLDLQKHNAQYPPIEIKTFKQAHDRFLIPDDESVYHLGASLKDLGKKLFAFSRFEKGALELLGRLSHV